MKNGEFSLPQLKYSLAVRTVAIHPEHAVCGAFDEQRHLLTFSRGISDRHAAFQMRAFAGIFVGQASFGNSVCEYAALSININ